MSSDSIYNFLLQPHINLIMNDMKQYRYCIPNMLMPQSHTIKFLSEFFSIKNCIKCFRDMLFNTAACSQLHETNYTMVPSRNNDKWHVPHTTD